jgi:hypothetical protein
MKRAYFTISDQNNLKFFVKLQNSFKKFHPNDELILFDEAQVQATGDPNFYYRATPFIADQLFKQGYDEVCKLDADTIITGNLDHIWEGDYDVAVVNNANPRETKAYPVSILDINPLAYVNCGFVVMKGKKFVEHWLGLCYSEHFPSYQMREQDFLNIMVFYMTEHFGGSYKVKLLDMSDKWHGLVSKGYWAQIELVDKKLILKKNDEWPLDGDKEIVAIHFAGGNDPKKMTDINIRFKPEVAKFLNELIK